MTEMLPAADALKVTDPQAVKWDREADVVVVGFGGAGAVAALEAREQGADVLIVERFEGGGATAYSGGIYYAGNTRYQREAGYQDPPENMYAYLSQEVGDAIRPETLKRFCDDSAANIEWLERHGVPFNGAYFGGKATFPPADKYLYYSGNEKIARFAATAKPAPRGHRVYGTGWTGYVFYGALREAVTKAAIPVVSHTRATRLVADGSGRVIGLEVLSVPAPQAAAHQAEYAKVNPLAPFTFDKVNKAAADAAALEQSAGERKLIRARNGVILATGGYSYNLDLLKQHLPKYAANADRLLRLGSLGDQGDGLRLGQGAGGALGKMDRLFCGRSLAPPDDLLDGIVVNQKGRRFINEDAYNATLGEAIADQPGSRAWLILPSGKFWSAVRHLLPRGDGNFMTFYMPVLMNVMFGGTRRGGTLAQLAQKCGIDPSALEDEVRRYNEFAKAGKPDPLGKLKDHALPIEDSSYWAINVSMTNRFSFMLFFTLGGLRVDERTGAVLRSDGTPIAGLYAAGRAAVGVCGQAYACSGISLADGVFSGRRAAQACAKARMPVLPYAVRESA